mmetsp:Transcript_12467/g.20472  ORF Transcript_12467/g.20472 Transcript_12467/m.20472 type:complete len:247 (+) Transcript_12467:32-772(+)
MKRQALRRRPAGQLVKASHVKRKPAAASKKPTLNLSSLKRRYFALRHGESEANVARIIISDPKVGVVRYGLTAHGKDMVVSTAAKFKSDILEAGGILPSEVAVVASDFKRASETAQIFHWEVCHAPNCLFDICLPERRLLRERRFGQLEAGPDDRYGDVWKVDATNVEARPFQSESCASVQRRTVAAVRSLEAKLDPSVKLVVLVSHGDALQILQTAFECISPGEHRSLKPLDRAELRELVPKSTS